MIKNKKSATSRHHVTTLFGYGLFGLLILAFLLTTVLPLASVFHHPTARHINIITLIVVFAIATILPTLAAYVIGDKSTHSKKNTLHHYNGVLFGFAAYWVAILLSWVNFSALFGASNEPYPAPLVATNIPPVILTLVAMSVLAFSFAKYQKKNTSVLHFFPYQLILAISVAGAFVAPYFSNLVVISVTSFGTLAVPLIATGIAYAALNNQKMSTPAQLSDALIAMSIGWITLWIAQSFLSLVQLPHYAVALASCAVALVTFVSYLYLRVRK